MSSQFWIISSKKWYVLEYKSSARRSTARPIVARISAMAKERCAGTSTSTNLDFRTPSITFRAPSTPRTPRAHALSFSLSRSPPVPPNTSNPPPTFTACPPLPLSLTAITSERAAPPTAAGPLGPPPLSCVGSVEMCSFGATSSSPRPPSAAAPASPAAPDGSASLSSRMLTRERSACRAASSSATRRWAWSSSRSLFSITTLARSSSQTAAAPSDWSIFRFRMLSESSSNASALPLCPAEHTPHEVRKLVRVTPRSTGVGALAIKKTRQTNERNRLRHNLSGPRGAGDVRRRSGRSASRGATPAQSPASSVRAPLRRPPPSAASSPPLSPPLPLPPRTRYRRASLRGSRWRLQQAPRAVRRSCWS